MARFKRRLVKGEIQIIPFTQAEEAKADAWENRVIPPPPPTELELLTKRVAALEARGGPPNV